MKDSKEEDKFAVSVRSMALNSDPHFADKENALAFAQYLMDVFCRHKQTDWLTRCHDGLSVFERGEDDYELVKTLKTEERRDADRKFAASIKKGLFQGPALSIITHD